MPGPSGQQDRAQGVRGASQCLAPPASAMTENSDKVPIALVGPDDVEFCSPPVSRARDPQSRCRVSGNTQGPGLARVSERTARSQGFAPPNVGGGCPTLRVCRGLGTPDGREGEGGTGFRRGRPVAGGACTARGPWPCSAESLLIAHPRLSTRGLRERGRRGAGVRAAQT